MYKIWIAVGTVAALLFSLFIIWPDSTTVWHEGASSRWAYLEVSHSSQAGFTRMDPSITAVASTNSLTKEQITANRHLLNGSGVAIGDVDRDGLADIYLARLDGPNALYMNLGNWKFMEMAAEAGVACASQFSTGCAFSDIDGDADLDLLVTANGGPNACLLNDGTGRFADVTNESGMSSETGAMTLALADIDGDADLDLYITNNKRRTVRDLYPPHLRTIDRTVEKVGDGYALLPEFQEHYEIEVKADVLERFEYAEPDMIFLNDGTGHFVRSSFTNGTFLDEDGKVVPEYTDWGLTVRFQDVDNDQDQDIYVCNDFESPDRFWINDGTGQFRAIAKLALRSTSSASMGIDFSDLEGDGDLDFFLTEMLSADYSRRKTQEGPISPPEAQIGQIDNRPQYMKNSLFLNRGDGTYAEVASLGGVEASEWSWTPIFLDVDLDGFEDLIISTGHYYDAMDVDTQTKLKTMSVAAYNQIGSEVFAYPPLKIPNFIFRNAGDLTFKDKSQEWGFETTDISHGMAVGDLDNDGDLDIVMNRLFEPPLLYRNDANAPRIAVRLKGMAPNTQASGAKIRLLGGPVAQSHEVIAGGNYLSHSDQLASFAATDPKGEFRLEISWPSGRKSTLDGVTANRIYEIDEIDAAKTNAATSDRVTEQRYFEDVSELINHLHQEDPFNDFERQPLLPKRLSQLGPGVTWLDYDRDGDDDLFVSSGRGGRMSILQNEGGMKFDRPRELPLPESAAMDQTALVGWTKREAESGLLLAFSNFEASSATDSYLEQFNFTSGRLKSKQQIAFHRSSPGPMALADYDGDGDLDLFVGGRCIPGRYPEPASSVMYYNEDSHFVVDEENSNTFKNIGLISGAMFSDIDNDADPDLLLSVEWGPITVMRNERGRFSDVTTDLGLAEYTGWWNGITTGDLNGDGRLDIIATNWGLNTPYRVNSGEPLQLFYSDFDNNGTLDILEAYFEVSRNSIVAHRGLAAIRSAIPFINYNTPSNKAFSAASLQEMIGPRLGQAKELQASVLEHTIFMNSENTFEAIPMPAEAQFSPAFYAGVADFDGDGHEDVFISQNFFAYPSETPRSDAGRGLWLKGHGTGNLTAVSGRESGIQVYGEQRGAALADFDRDGRVDIAISQNGASTKLYHNRGAKPGLRVRLVGPPENRCAIGATIRLIYENRYGPSREIHGGSGYWSQDSAVQVMGTAEPPKGVWVRWPDGRTEQYMTVDGVSEVTVRHADVASGNPASSIE